MLIFSIFFFLIVIIFILLIINKNKYYVTIDLLNCVQNCYTEDSSGTDFINGKCLRIDNCVNYSQHLTPILCYQCNISSNAPFLTANLD